MAVTHQDLVSEEKSARFSCEPLTPLQVDAIRGMLIVAFVLGSVLLSTFLIIFLITLAFGDLSTVVDYPFKLQVNSLDAKLSSSTLNSSMDLNVTLTLTNNKFVLFESFMVLLAYDNDDDDDVVVISPTKEIDPSNYQGSDNSLKTMKFGMTTLSSFTKLRKDEDEFSLNIWGKYWTIVDNNVKDSETCFKIVCDGIKVVFVSSSSDITTGTMIRGPVRCEPLERDMTRMEYLSTREKIAKEEQIMRC